MVTNSNQVDNVLFGTNGAISGLNNSFSMILGI
jgi:hypothetical protein